MQANGLVETCHGVGTFVLNTPSPSGLRIDPATIVSLRDMLAVLELRNGLEVDSAGLAAQRRNKQQLEDIRDALDNFKKSANQTSGIQASDFQFHMRICEATGNNYFIDIMQHIGACVIPRLQLYSEDFQLHDLKLSLISEYDQVYDAIMRQDAEAAKAAMRLHLINSRTRLQKAFESNAEIKAAETA
tara:strand:- start:138 stop:701 length:564 start_codon:yes stop_codon:yes gene_type:complete